MSKVFVGGWPSWAGGVALVGGWPSWAGGVALVGGEWDSRWLYEG